MDVTMLHLPLVNGLIMMPPLNKPLTICVL